jgi:hypothetical protein
MVLFFVERKWKKKNKLGGGGSAASYNFNITDIFTNKN